MLGSGDDAACFVQVVVVLSVRLALAQEGFHGGELPSGVVQFGLELIDVGA
ncbi:hypothetical protein ACFZAR_36335 [Streptomyces sp. NPDC008222]|uniref:hypothetical protein n=1 Tax=Streptomyces sp. NPDC008222 TaxID=3364820 RepID=UPI0036E87AB8